MKKTLALSILFSLFSTSSWGNEPNFVDLDEATKQFFEPLRIGNSELLFSDAVEWVLASEKFLTLRPLESRENSHIKDKYSEDYIKAILNDDSKVMYVARKNLNPFEIKKYKDEFLDEYYKKYNIAKNIVLSKNIKTTFESDIIYLRGNNGYDFEKERYDVNLGRNDTQKDDWSKNWSNICGKAYSLYKYIHYKLPSCTNVFINIPVDKAEELFTKFNDAFIEYKAYFVPDEPDTSKCWNEDKNPYPENDVDLSKSSCLNKKLYKMTATFMSGLVYEKKPIFNEEFPVVFE